MKIHLFQVLFLTIFFNLNGQIDVETNFNDDNSVEFRYSKTLPGSYLLKISFTSLTNASHQGFMNYVKDAGGPLFTLKPTNSTAQVGFHYTYSYWPVAKAKPDLDIIHALPFENQKKVRVIPLKNVFTEYISKERSAVDENWVAYGFVSASNKVLCTRKGIVINLINSYQTNNSEDLTFTTNTNSVTLEHPDGTYSRYNGFKKDGFSIQLGATVYPGEEIGIIDSKFQENYLLKFQFFLRRPIIDGHNVEIKNFYIEPTFQTEKGQTKIYHHRTYASSIDQTLIFQEMKKREIKRYLKANK